MLTLAGIHHCGRNLCWDISTRSCLFNESSFSPTGDHDGIVQGPAPLPDRAALTGAHVEQMRHREEGNIHLRWVRKRSFKKGNQISAIQSTDFFNCTVGSRKNGRLYELEKYFRSLQSAKPFLKNIRIIFISKEYFLGKSWMRTRFITCFAPVIRRKALRSARMMKAISGLLTLVSRGEERERSGRHFPLVFPFRPFYPFSPSDDERLKFFRSCLSWLYTRAFPPSIPSRYEGGGESPRLNWILHWRIP